MKKIFSLLVLSFPFTCWAQQAPPPSSCQVTLYNYAVSLAQQAESSEEKGRLIEVLKTRLQAKEKELEDLKKPKVEEKK